MTTTLIVASLAAAPDVGQINLSWLAYNSDNTPLANLNVVEVWSSTTNDRSTASQVTSGVSSAVQLVSDLSVHFYWIRAKDIDGVSYSSWYPSSSTDGIPGISAPPESTTLINGVLSVTAATGALYITVVQPNGNSIDSNHPAFLSFGSYTLPITAPLTLVVPHTKTIGMSGVPRMWVVIYQSQSDGNLYLGVQTCSTSANGPPATVNVYSLRDGFLDFAHSSTFTNGTTLGTTPGYVYSTIGNQGAARIIAYMEWSSITPGDWVVPTYVVMVTKSTPLPGQIVASHGDFSWSQTGHLFTTGASANCLPLPLDNTIPVLDLHVTVSEGYFFLQPAFSVNYHSPYNYMVVEYAALLAPDAANQFVAVMLRDVSYQVHAVGIARSPGVGISVLTYIKARLPVMSFIGTALAYSGTGSVAEGGSSFSLGQSLISRWGSVVEYMG